MTYLRTNRSALHDKILIDDLHAVEALARVVSGVGIEVLAESVALRGTSGSVAHQVERFECAEDLQQLAHIGFVQVWRDTSNKDLIRGVLDVGTDNVGHRSCS